MRVVSTLLSIPLMIGLAVPAHAGPSGDDAVFLASLERAGITYSHPDQAIASGKAVCALVESGESGLQVVNELRTAIPGFRWTVVASSLRSPRMSIAPTRSLKPASARNSLG